MFPYHVDHILEFLVRLFREFVYLEEVPVELRILVKEGFWLEEVDLQVVIWAEVHEGKSVKVPFLEEGIPLDAALKVHL